MPLLLQYLTKLSLCLIVIYLFYEIVLRRLTFYKQNRIFLLAYSILSFFIPLINVFPLFNQANKDTVHRFTYIPSIENYIGNVSPTQNIETYFFNIWNIIIIIFCAGMICVSVRFVLSLLSLRKMFTAAKLHSLGKCKIYETDEDIAPFSFGSSMMVNTKKHNENELEKIVQHEFVHIRQKHTVDMVWSEVLCILNWYNPFAWLIRKAMRQNLEFIADNEVINAGIKKKEYQYLLLKVVGNNAFSAATHFNFSSLKKRITMMNKLKTTKIHLLKFLFLLPMLAIILLSFRKTIRQPGKNSFVVSGIVVDVNGYEPIENAVIEDTQNNIRVVTDKKGFYTYETSNMNEQKISLNIKVSKEGYKTIGCGMSSEIKESQKEHYSITNIGLSKLNALAENNAFSASKSEEYLPTYKAAKEYLVSYINDIKIENEIKAAGKVIAQRNGITYIVGIGSSASTSSSNPKIFVDKKPMTIDEINKTIRPAGIVGVSINGDSIKIELRNAQNSSSNNEDLSEKGKKIASNSIMQKQALEMSKGKDTVHKIEMPDAIINVKDRAPKNKIEVQDVQLDYVKTDTVQPERLIINNLKRKSLNEKAKQTDNAQQRIQIDDVKIDVKSNPDSTNRIDVQ